MIIRYQYLKVYRNSINTKSWVKDVIQGFAQKAVKLNTKMSKKLGKKTKLAKFPVIPANISEIPGNSRREFWGPRFPGIPEREFPVALPPARAIN